MRYWIVIIMCYLNFAVNTDRIMYFLMDFFMLVFITIVSKTFTTANQSVLIAWLAEFMFFPYDKCGLKIKVENEEKAHRKIALSTWTSIEQECCSRGSDRIQSSKAASDSPLIPCHLWACAACEGPLHNRTDESATQSEFIPGTGLFCTMNEAGVLWQKLFLCI